VNTSCADESEHATPAECRTTGLSFDFAAALEAHKRLSAAIKGVVYRISDMHADVEPDGDDCAPSKPGPKPGHRNGLVLDGRFSHGQRLVIVDGKRTGTEVVFRRYRGWDSGARKVEVRMPSGKIGTCMIHMLKAIA
jgi:hypothetical protein